MVDKSVILLSGLIVALLPAVVLWKGESGAKCPYNPSRSLPAEANFNASAFSTVDFDAVKADLKALLTDSQPFWPADGGHYGGLLIRLAWHCGGTYRSSDGRGGCDGARQRFEPERSWEDNTNLDKARALLRPIKLKHGAGLSWGDLIVLAGNVAIEQMGAPVLGFCAGRIDDLDGSESEPLGPTPLQESISPCPVNGKCKLPLGASKVGLIYVNPEGPMNKPDPRASAQDVRDTFGRMGMNDYETVVLIGGGHAFGKVHGACPTGAGPSPKEDPYHPWPGTCGKGKDMGKGPNTFTAGFEGAWTTKPTTWDNEYFQNLLDFDWEVHVGPGGRHQWRPLKKGPDGREPAGTMMMTSDIALINDPSYLELVKRFASNLTELSEAFAIVWYKMASRDMGPVTRCLGNDVPAALPFQFPLPDPPKKLANFDSVRKAIVKAMTTDSDLLAADKVDGKPSYAALFATLAKQCASTFRATDYRGGCNGARIRFSPENSWAENAHLDKALQLLEPIKKKFGDSLSYADLIVLAGQTAVEEAGGMKLKFCGGRVDATDGAGSENLEPRSYPNPLVGVKDTIKVMGLTPREYVALRGAPRSLQQQQRLGYSGSWLTDSVALSNQFFKVLLGDEWQKQTAPNGQDEFKAANTGGSTDIFMLPEDLILKVDPELAVIAEEFAVDNDKFLNEFGAAWTKLMNADRFGGLKGNVCTAQ